MISKTLVGVVAITLVASGVWFFFARQSDAPSENPAVTDEPTTTNTPTTNIPEDTDTSGGDVNNTSADETTPSVVEVHMTSSGFSPTTLTIQSGTTVRWINDDSRPHWPASDVHPTHQVYSEFDPKGSIAVGESWDFTFDKAGEWRFHDHLNASMTGTLTVLP